MNRLGYSNVIQECFENLLLAEKQLRLKEADFQGNLYKYQANIEYFWKDIELISKKLSFECTKLCISFSNEPLPSSTETSALLQSVEAAVLTLVSIVFKLDASNGRTLHDEVISSAINTIQSVRQLLRVIKDENEEEIKSRYLQATGIAWEGCKHLEKCSHSNKEAVTKILSNHSSLVGDAFEEISEALEGDGKGWDQLDIAMNSDDDDEANVQVTWSLKDKELMAPTVNLIKAAKILYKRLLSGIDKNGLCETSKQLEDFDLLFQDCKPISATIDNLILEMYPPLNVPEMELQAQLLANHIQSTLKTATNSHLITEIEQSNIEFISQAVSHNLDKLKVLLKEI